MVHQGKHYSVGHYFTGVASSGTALLRLTIGSSAAHSKFSVASGAESKIEVLEGSTYSAGGVSKTIFNNNRSSANVSSCTATHTPTVNVAGTVIYTELIPGGNGGNSIGGSGHGFMEQFVLAPSTDYLIRVTNNGSGSENIGVIVSYYEQ